MDDGIYRAASGMLLENTRQEAIARNLASGALPGYKRDFVVSESFASQLNKQLGESKTSDLLGASSGKLYVDFSPGAISRTDRRLDFAIENDCRQSGDPDLKDSQIFFQVQGPDGKTFYTQNGSFALDSNLNLVTKDGYPVMADGGSITLGADDNVDNLIVTSDGQIRIEDKTTSPSTIKNIGNLLLTRVSNPQALSRVSSNYFADLNGKVESVSAEPENFNVMNGYLEQSNATPMQDMTSMITSMREYEMNSKIIKTLEDRFSKEQSRLGK